MRVRSTGREIPAGGLVGAGHNEPKEEEMSEARAEVRAEVRGAIAQALSGAERLVIGPSVLDWPLEVERVEGGMLLSVGRYRVLLEGEDLGRLREFLSHAAGRG